MISFYAIIYNFIYAHKYLYTGCTLLGSEMDMWFWVYHQRYMYINVDRVGTLGV